VEYKKSASSIHRATEIMREKTNEYRSSFNSNQRPVKLSTSTPKNQPPTYSASYSTITSTVLNDEEKDRLKKKQSLKDMLRGKKEKTLPREKSEGKIDRCESGSRYEGLVNYNNYAKDYGTKSYGTSPLLAKYYKGGTVGGPKENRLYGKC
jgi:hypothetical protein